MKKDTGYAMRAWLDLSKPMPARMLTIDDVLKGLLEQYRAMYGKPAPLDVATKCWRLVEEAKKEFYEIKKVFSPYGLFGLVSRKCHLGLLPRTSFDDFKSFGGFWFSGWGGGDGWFDGILLAWHFMTKMGFKRDPSQKRKPIKAVSKKQRLRTSSLQANFQRVLGVQRELYGENFCQPGAGEWREKCPNNKGKRYPLVPDHVNTRNGKDVDRHGNLQPACSWCNYQKGSKRIDFRPPEMVAACEGLDKKVGADLKKCSNNLACWASEDQVDSTDSIQ